MKPKFRFPWGKKKKIETALPTDNGEEEKG
jgi:hypothetical protein